MELCTELIDMNEVVFGAARHGESGASVCVLPLIMRPLCAHKHTHSPSPSHSISFLLSLSNSLPQILPPPLIPPLQLLHC